VKENNDIITEEIENFDEWEEKGNLNSWRN
jgi:hypothetical protein